MLHSLAALVLLVLPGDQDARPPLLRLPDGVRPVRQAIELSVDPSLEAYTGVVEIELEIAKPARVVWLNANNLKITSASLGSPGDLHAAQVVPGGDDFIGFARDQPLAGPARLRASFEGVVSRRDTEGAFTMKEGGDWYLFTQFEAIAARKAFPCFDEPSYKIPWQVTLRVPRGLVALSNMPAVSTSTEGDRDVVRFAWTPPLPSYLVAIAVGPFEFVDLGSMGRGRTPARLVVPKGRGADTVWARESTPRILAQLEDYFDRPYPYEKLDQVAIPGVYFAMEHPGLVTYGQTFMVQRAAEETIASRRTWADLCAHELAHQWFGDLVTMAWWDDTWLNESFASWLGEKVIDRLHPDWGIAEDRAARRSDALKDDSLSTARMIRQPVVSKDDIHNVFDGITYNKGAAVLEMVEAWLGADAFRSGVQAYIDRHAWSNATAADFAVALSSRAGRDVGAVLNSFLDQTGAPVISAEVRCDPPLRLLLSQRPYRALGSPAEAKRWSVPVCARVAGQDAAVCSLLSETTGEIPLDAACPEWSFGNAGAAGYYRTVQSAASLRRVLEGSHLSAVERVALAGDLDALLTSGDVPAGEALELLPLLSRDASRQVVSESIRLVEGLEPLMSAALNLRFETFVRGLYESRARQLGWSSRPGESEDVRLLRKSVVGVTAGLGRDETLLQEALALAWRWLEDPSVVDPDLVSTVLASAAGAGDRLLFDRMREEVLRPATDREQRKRLFAGLGSVRDGALAHEALALTLDERVDARESVWMLWMLGSRRETRRAAFDFLKAHYDALVARLPGGEFSTPVYFPWIATGLCGSDARREIEDFFRERSARLDGGPRILAQALEAVDHCSAVSKAQGPGVAAFLETQPGR